MNIKTIAPEQIIYLTNHFVLSSSSVILINPPPSMVHSLNYFLSDDLNAIKWSNHLFKH